ncbi:ATP-binding protein [Clostridium sp. LY3-2]|uniref:ATP-binding protein n=1 Tax=Clostridium sp. LY3-2 TaxID=2942482 RepID=UPI00215295D6|nr:ATP-binding protein [Clostridium sp. LY3-2]MCR6516299.1 ATP-binding protein [Clostridium sp. LY3-2]
MKNEEELKKNLIKDIEQEKCPLCSGTGWQLTKDNTYIQCDCIKLIRDRELFERSGINFKDIDKSFSTFVAWNDEVRSMKDIATSYYLNFSENRGKRSNSIMFCGSPGSGKTHLALALANNLMNKKNISVVYMSYRDVITKLKQNMVNESIYTSELEKYKNADVLLIDDLFKGKISETDINIVFEIINHRYLKYAPIIISTEMFTNGLLDVDEAIGSRLIEMSKSNLVEIRGRENNYRLR